MSAFKIKIKTDTKPPEPGKTAVCVLVGMEGVNGETPELDVLFAGQSNPNFLNAAFKLGEPIDRIEKHTGTTTKILARRRAVDRELYPKHIIRGMRHVPNENGEAVPYSPEAAVELVSLLPDDLFDQVRVFCNEPRNFTETMFVEGVAKN